MQPLLMPITPGVLAGDPGQARQTQTEQPLTADPPVFAELFQGLEQVAQGSPVSAVNEVPPLHARQILFTQGGNGLPETVAAEAIVALPASQVPPQQPNFAAGGELAGMPGIPGPGGPAQWSDAARPATPMGTPAAGSPGPKDAMQAESLARQLLTRPGPATGNLAEPLTHGVPPAPLMDSARSVDAKQPVAAKPAQSDPDLAAALSREPETELQRPTVPWREQPVDGQLKPLQQQAGTAGADGPARGLELSSLLQIPVAPMLSPATPLSRMSEPAMVPISLPQTLDAADWGEHFAERITLAASRQVKHAQLFLNPPELGPVEVKIALANNEASISFTAQHASVREALEAALPRLREMMAANGIDQVNVDVSDQGPRQQAGGHAAEQQMYAGAEVRQTYSDPLLAEAGLDPVIAVAARQGLIDAYA